MPLTLFTTANNYQKYKIQIAAALTGQDLKVDEVKTVHDKTPIAKAPVLDTGNGLVFQSNAIMRFLARNAPASLAYGQSVLDSAQVDQWIDYCLNEFEPCRGVWLFPVLKMMTLDMRAYNQAKKDVSKVMKVFNAHLQSNTYFVGNAPTIADAAIFSALLDMYSTVFAPGYIKGFTNVTRWFNTVAHHPAFAGVVGEVTFATQEKKAPAPPKKKQQQQQKPKKQKQQQQQKPKKKKAPKPKHPLDALEPSPMGHLDTTKKKFFTQKPFNPDFFPAFWDTWDGKGFCFYKADYQYNSDNEVFWKTENQPGMYCQRLLHARKWTFGTLMINGESEENPPWTVEYLFMFRGQGVPQEVLDVPDSEYYTFTPVDASTPEGKALVEACFCGETVQGRKVLSRRYFK